MNARSRFNARSDASIKAGQMRRHLPGFCIGGLLLACGVLPSSARAACELGSGGIYLASLSLPASVTVPRDAPVGAVVASTRFSYAFNQSYPVGVYCTTGTTVDNTSGSGASSSNGIIPTNAPGLGFRLRLGADDYVPDTGSYTVPVSVFNTPSRCGYPASGKCYIYLGTPIVLELVKTGEVSPNTSVSGGLLFTQRLGGLTASKVTLSTPQVKVVPQSCTVTSRSISVQFGQVGANTFQKVGSVSPSVPLGISIDCRGVSSRVAVTFTDVTSPGNRSNVLSLTSASSATGLGIQILSGTRPISFGPDSATAGNPNQVPIGAVNNTVYEAPFSARYIRTASTITGGTANGAATFTMSYQ
ncbi:Fimbrial domain-containing protein [Burkholderia cenocepacia]|uniref:fimbrial protein n=1 Tax=Burkholderia cenocepacia TaxID=95486 RepID=UPI00192B8187|nr:fimbrial protein [Burkholderia cenocepacia]CAD9223354.1 Fimbrial domain-containing protein [Burkholderia cenocepacia]